MIKCRDYKKFSYEYFENSLNENLQNNTEFDYNRFEEIVLNLFSSQAPLKERMVPQNQRVFMNKEIHNAIVVRSRQKNIFLGKNAFSRDVNNKKRNYCVKLIRESKIKYFGNLNVKKITESKKFWSIKNFGYCQKFMKNVLINENVMWRRYSLIFNVVYKHDRKSRE